MPDKLNLKQAKFSLHKKKEASQYVELQVTTNFSFLRGGSRPEELCEQAVKLGYKALAITDLQTLSGVIRAHVAAKALGISLIVGCCIEIYNGLPPVEQRPYSLLLYPTSKDGYKALCSLLTTGKLRAPKGQCFITLDDIQAFNQDLLAIVVINDFKAKGLVPELEKLKEIFQGDRLSLAITSIYNPKHKKHLAISEQLSSELAIPLVVTNSVYYHTAERRMLQDVLTCIRLGTTIEAAGFNLFQNAERYLKPPAEIARQFNKYPSAVQRTHDIAKQALNFSIDELKYEYPKEICPDTLTPESYLRELTYAGIEKRYPTGVTPAIKTQIEAELKLIRELDYEKYFLTVYDIVAYARSIGILCQGRGAAANSAVCYVLGITAVNPAEISLLFERFVSKERNEPPDIDIDFEHERREEVIQYIYNKYGRHRAALVCEVVSYRTRSAIRDIGKVFGIPPETITLLVRLFTRSEDSQSFSEQLTKFGLSLEDHAILHTIRLSQILSGFPRHLSQHVGGFVISDQPLSELVTLENAAMPNRTVMEWDKDDIESVGMLKIDVLGLGMLTCISKSFALLNERLSEPVELYAIPRDDPAVYEMISRADTVGVFQIESRAQMSMLPRLRPKEFYDLVIEVAIVRPGPIQGGMVHPYLRRRNGEEPIVYPSKEIEKILRPTLGVPIFQEQVMELSVIAAGFTPGEADELRRVMAGWKRNKEAFLRFGNKLIGGMLKKGYTKEFAERLFEQIKGFGEYGFPQSHSASFALLAYASSWLKKHYPAAFATALINSQPMGFYQPAQIIEDAKAHGVSILPIDVNHSAWDCTLEYSETTNFRKDYATGRVPGDSSSKQPRLSQAQLRDTNPAIRLGMRMIKGISRTAAETIAADIQSGGPARSILELWRRTNVGVSQLKHLANADIFRSMGLDRQQALWQIKTFRDERLPLIEGYEDEGKLEEKLPLMPPQFHVLRDYQRTGLSLKAHPMSFVRESLPATVTPIGLLKEKPQSLNGKRLTLAGIVLIRQAPSTAKGIIFITIEDETGTTNLIVRPKVFKRYKNEILDSVFMAVSGPIQYANGVIHLIVEKAENLNVKYAGLDSIARDFR